MKLDVAIDTIAQYTIRNSETGTLLHVLHLVRFGAQQMQKCCLHETVG